MVDKPYRYCHRCGHPGQRFQQRCSKCGRRFRRRKVTFNRLFAQVFIVAIILLIVALYLVEH